MMGIPGITNLTANLLGLVLLFKLAGLLITGAIIGVVVYFVVSHIIKNQMQNTRGQDALSVLKIAAPHSSVFKRE